MDERPNASPPEEPTPNLEAPETIQDLSALTPEQLRAAAEKLERELEAPQTRKGRRRKHAALTRIELRLGRHIWHPGEAAPAPSRRAERRLRPRAGTAVTPFPRRLPKPERALDAFLATLEGWNLDWTDAEEIARVGVPRYSPTRALAVLVAAMAEGRLARPARAPEPDEAAIEQLALPIRGAREAA